MAKLEITTHGDTERVYLDMDPRAMSRRAVVVRASATVSNLIELLRQYRHDPVYATQLWKAAPTGWLSPKRVLWEWWAQVGPPQ